MVRTLAAKGLSGDVIAARLGANKNFLRAEYALDLHAGREIKWADKAAADAAELPRFIRVFSRAIYRATSKNFWFSGCSME